MSLASQQRLTRRTSPSFNIRFPRNGSQLGQDEEWFEYDLHGQSERLRIHDYAGLYNIPGLYEALIYEKLTCTSPHRLANLFSEVLNDQRADAGELRVLDLGAGNGIVAEEMQKIGVRHLVGLDLLPEAKLAAQRDRPWLYKDYLVTDLCDLSEEDRSRLADSQLNCLVTVAALGFGDIPPLAFATAFNSLSAQGLLGMTIKEDFLSPNDDSGFARLIRMLENEQIIEIQAHQRYCHRLSINGKKLFYVAVVARKLRHIPASLLDAIGDGTSPEMDDSSAEQPEKLFGT